MQFIACSRQSQFQPLREPFTRDAGSWSRSLHFKEDSSLIGVSSRSGSIQRVALPAGETIPERARLALAQLELGFRTADPDTL